MGVDVDVSSALQNVLICTEMLLASWCHLWIWPPSDSDVVLEKIEERHGKSHRVASQLDAPSFRTGAAVNLGDIVGTVQDISRLTSFDPHSAPAAPPHSAPSAPVIPVGPAGRQPVRVRFPQMYQ